METPTITIEEMDCDLLYIRFRGSYTAFRKASRSLLKELFQFAEEQQLIDPDQTKIMTIYDDNPFITEDKHLRTSVAMTIPTDTAVQESGQICRTSLTGTFAVAHFELSAKEYGDAWHYIYHDWLFKEANAITPRDAAPFELYVTEPPKNAKDKSFTDFYIPIE